MSAPTLASLDGQGLLQIGELLLAFALASLIGFERQLRRKPAGLRTQALVGTTAALLMLVSGRQRSGRQPRSAWRPEPASGCWHWS